VSQLPINVITLAISLAFSAGAMAQGISKNDYQAGKDAIAAEYKSAKAGCASLSGNRSDICIAEARGAEKVAMADLDASYKPSPKTRYQARAVKADADLVVAKERCDDMAGNAKDVCVKEATAAAISAKADAKAQMKTSEANTSAREKTADARNEANDKAAIARKDANAEKLDAQYSVAKEKCDVYADSARDYCLERAKARFGAS